jgi:hypothetical protein
MHCAVMPPTERDSELVTHFATERARLGKSEMMGIRRLAAAHETRLLGYIVQMFAVAITTRSPEREDALVSSLRLIQGGAFGGDDLRGPVNLGHRRTIVQGCARIGRWELQKRSLKRVLHELGIDCGKAVFGRKRPARPFRGEAAEVMSASSVRSFSRNTAD